MSSIASEMGLTPWADLHLSHWAATKRSLHLYTQMLGKLRLALSPAQPNWMFTPLSLSARGLTTGPIPYGEGSVQASLDFFASSITITRSNGTERSLQLQPARTVAEVYHEVVTALAQLAGAESLPIAPASASWSTELREWVLPYDDVRLSEHPGGVLRGFLDSVYAHCFDAAGWSRNGLTYSSFVMVAAKQAPAFPPGASSPKPLKYSVFLRSLAPRPDEKSGACLAATITKLL